MRKLMVFLCLLAVSFIWAFAIGLAPPQAFANSINVITSSADHQLIAPVLNIQAVVDPPDLNVTAIDNVFQLRPSYYAVDNNSFTITTVVVATPGTASSNTVNTASAATTNNIGFVSTNGPNIENNIYLTGATGANDVHVKGAQGDIV